MDITRHSPADYRPAGLDLSAAEKGKQTDNAESRRGGRSNRTGRTGKIADKSLPAAPSIVSTSAKTAEKPRNGPRIPLWVAVVFVAWRGRFGQNDRCGQHWTESGSG